MTATLNKWDILDSDEVGWKPHPKQVEVVSSSARNRVVSAGRRFGKSDIGGHELIPEAFLTFSQRVQLKEENKRREFWIVGPEYSDSEKEFRVIYNSMKKLGMPFDKPGTYYDAIHGSMHISAWDGVFQVHAQSAKIPDTLVGEGLSGVILAEAAKLKERVWTKFIRPTLSDFEGWALFSSTPEGKNWFYDAYRKGKDPKNPDWSSWRCPAWLNPYVYKTPTRTAHVKKLQALMKDDNPRYRSMSVGDIVQEFNLIIDSEIQSLIMDITEESFNQEIGADFSEFVGRVFKNFDEEVHVGDFVFDPTWETYGAVDYGFTNPSVWLLIQVGPWGDVRVLDEMYEPGLTAEEFAKEIKRRGLCPEGLRTFYPDPASPGDTRQLESILKVRSTGGTGGELKPRLDRIRQALKTRPVTLPVDHPDRHPELTIDRRCVNMIREMNDYRYPEKRSQQDTNHVEAPMKKDDHAPEALGRFYAGKFGTPDRIASQARTSSAFKGGREKSPLGRTESGIYIPGRR
jgi:hypothetical protein